MGESRLGRRGIEGQKKHHVPQAESGRQPEGGQV